jgi:hypothetical protein
MAMNCAQFAEAVHDLERPGTEGFKQRVSALEHAESCARCGLLLEDVTTLNFALDRLAMGDADVQASPAVEMALVSEFRKHHAEAVASMPSRNWRLAFLAAAAAAILAVSLGIQYWTAPKQGVASVSSNVAAQAVSPANATIAPDDEVASVDSSDYATGFVALPYADDPATLDGGTVVRVTLSRAALASFGLPVADMNSTDQIPADIALSEDGVPQAIRLVASADLNQVD